MFENPGKALKMLNSKTIAEFLIKNPAITVDDMKRFKPRDWPTAKPFLPEDFVVLVIKVQNTTLLDLKRAIDLINERQRYSEMRLYNVLDMLTDPKSWLFQNTGDPDGKRHVNIKGLTPRPDKIKPEERKPDAYQVFGYNAARMWYDTLPFEKKAKIDDAIERRTTELGLPSLANSLLVYWHRFYTNQHYQQFILNYRKGGHCNE
jgi:hypothetical protein